METLEQENEQEMKQNLPNYFIDMDRKLTNQEKKQNLHHSNPFEHLTKPRKLEPKSTWKLIKRGALNLF